MANNQSQIPAPMQAKLRSLQEAMKRDGLSALLFYSTGQLSMLEVNPVLWISGLLPMGPNTAVLVTESGDAAMLISLPWDQGRVRRQTWIHDVRVAERFVDAVQALVQQKGLKGKIGIIGWAFMPAAVYKALEGALEGRVEIADSILSALTRFPGRAALPALQRAAEIADIGFSAVLKKARIGMPEHELAAEVEYAMRSQGAEDNFGMVTASDHSHCTHPPGDRKIQPGDTIIGEITPAIDGHFVQLCRTAVMGAASPLLREKFAILEQAMDKSLEQVRAGKKAGAISQAINQVFTAYGYEKYCRPPYMRVRGHGLGFLSIPFSEIVDENEAVIEEGMCFVVHPNQYLPETGYLMLGDTVWVEANGPRRLTRTPMKLFTIED
ncbi:MAG: aminopeptidase P family protein [Candidatus Manganitrophaceae bacterium]|nr:MAG: aminopeptidase P family protein [Candidatus Manganitrophaceae bacterium]